GKVLALGSPEEVLTKEQRSKMFLFSLFYLLITNAKVVIKEIITKKEVSVTQKIISLSPIKFLHK
ncbi:MAG: hypothetical protein IIT61_06135, partial [Bacteroidales bacterium]|nr:hypothetical protein [Bacteroidales bacterium]